jgi:hypothetical protein
MYLLCLHDFNEGGIQAKAGDVLHGVPEGVANRLLDSWPGCWERLNETVEVGTMGVLGVGHAFPHPVETAAIDAPPVDKMMRKAKAKRRG